MFTIIDVNITKMMKQIPGVINSITYDSVSNVRSDLCKLWHVHIDSVNN